MGTFFSILGTVCAVLWLVFFIGFLLYRGAEKTDEDKKYYTLLTISKVGLIVTSVLIVASIIIVKIIS